MNLKSLRSLLEELLDLFFGFPHVFLRQFWHLMHCLFDLSVIKLNLLQVKLVISENTTNRKQSLLSLS